MMLVATWVRGGAGGGGFDGRPANRLDCAVQIDVTTIADITIFGSPMSEDMGHTIPDMGHPIEDMGHTIEDMSHSLEDIDHSVCLPFRRGFSCQC